MPQVSEETTWTPVIARLGTESPCWPAEKSSNSSSSLLPSGLPCLGGDWKGRGRVVARRETGRKNRHFLRPPGLLKRRQSHSCLSSSETSGSLMQDLGDRAHHCQHTSVCDPGYPREGLASVFVYPFNSSLFNSSNSRGLEKVRLPWGATLFFARLPHGLGSPFSCCTEPRM